MFQARKSHVRSEEVREGRDHQGEEALRCDWRVEQLCPDAAAGHGAALRLHVQTEVNTLGSSRTWQKKGKQNISKILLN